MRLKAVEAMAAGKAIVSTRVGMEGVDAVNGKSFIQADTPAVFADSIARLLDNARERKDLGENARHIAVEKFDWSSLAVAAEKFYSEVL
jgi:glycosyltransferase involved in cell wall biosynthesis